MKWRLGFAAQRAFADWEGHARPTTNHREQLPDARSMLASGSHSNATSSAEARVPLGTLRQTGRRHPAAHPLRTWGPIAGHHRRGVPLEPQPQGVSQPGCATGPGARRRCPHVGVGARPRAARLHLGGIGRELGYVRGLQLDPEKVSRRIAEQVAELHAAVGDLDAPNLHRDQMGPALAQLNTRRVA